MQYPPARHARRQLDVAQSPNEEVLNGYGLGIATQYHGIDVKQHHFPRASLGRPHSRRTNKHMHRPSDTTIIGIISGPAAGMRFAPSHPWSRSLFA